MNNYKPYSYLYKRTSEPSKLKSCFVVKVPNGKKITLRSGDPYTNGNETKIRYDISSDLQARERQEEHEHEFAWDGNPHNVIIKLLDGSTIEGKAILITKNAEEL